MDDRVAAIIVAGLGGGLDPSLRVGDVVIDDPSDLLGKRYTAFRFGKIETAGDIVATPEEKAELRGATGALAVDMEASAVRCLGRRMDILVVNIRAISDAATDGLDARLLSIIDDVGRIRVGKFISLILRHPLSFPQIIRTGWRAKVALRELAKATVQIIEGL
jgi:nucleoside phosphorylase